MDCRGYAESCDRISRGGVSAHESLSLKRTQWHVSLPHVVGCQAFTPAGNSDRECGSFGKDLGPTTSITLSGASLRERPQFGKFQAQTTTASGSGLPQEQDDDTTNLHKPDGNRSEPDDQGHSALLQSPDQKTALGTMSGGSSKINVMGSLEVEPQLKEIDDLVKSMRGILFKAEYGLGERLSDEDDKAVRAVLAYHPMYKKKVGCGVDYIKVDLAPGFQDVKCFWLVRTDGSEIDFSFHKCLKMKVLREFPSYIDRYDALYCFMHTRQWYPAMVSRNNQM